MTPGAGIEPGTHWWKASALTTTPTLLPESKRIRTVQRSPLAQISFTPGLLTHKTSNPSPSQTEHLSGNETLFPSEK